MADVQWNVFAYIVSEVEVPLTQAVTDTTNAFLAFVATPLKIALVLYVALTGLLLARGESNEPGSLIINRIIKLAIITWIITGSGAYQQWVYDFFFTTLPNDLSNALTSSNAGGAISANSFDNGWTKSWRAGLEVWNRLSWKDIGPQIAVLLFWMASIIANVFCFAIWLISRVFLALYIALGPLLIPLALFPATRALFERWIGALISCIVLQITTIVLLYIILLTEQQVVTTVAATTEVSGMEGIQVLLSGIIFFAVAGFVAVKLPGVASSLAGGLTFHTGAIARGMRAAVGSTGSAPGDRQGRGGAFGAGHYAYEKGRAGIRGARALAQRIRPSTGGSLSDRGAR